MGKELLTAAAGETLLLLGNEAIARGALEGGVRFVTCYPGTPSSEVPDTFFRMTFLARTIISSGNGASRNCAATRLNPSNAAPALSGEVPM